MEEEYKGISKYTKRPRTEKIKSYGIKGISHFQILILKIITGKYRFLQKISAELRIGAGAVNLLIIFGERRKVSLMSETLTQSNDLTSWTINFYRGEKIR